jgi:hypothetical protein
MSLDPNRAVAVAGLVTEDAFRAAGEAVKARLADAIDDGMIAPMADVGALARLAYVCAGDAILASLDAAEGRGEPSDA